MVKEIIDLLVSEEILDMSIGDMIKSPDSEVICNDQLLTITTKLGNKLVTLSIRKNKENK